MGTFGIPVVFRFVGAMVVSFVVGNIVVGGGGVVEQPGGTVKRRITC